MIDTRCQNFTLLETVNYPDSVYPVSIWRTLDYSDYIKIFACIVVIIGGILGNTCIILIVALNRSMRTTINLYIANLAATDAMICIVCMIPQILDLLCRVYVLGEFMCKFSPFMEMICLVCSVLTLSAISCDRFIAVMYPLHVRVTKQRTSVVITIVWIISIAVAIPFLLFKNYEIVVWKDLLEAQCNDNWPWYVYYDEKEQKCLLNRPLRTTYIIVLTITLYFLPIFIMIIAYSLILWKLWMSSVPGEQHEANISIQTRARIKVHKMVFVVLFTFIICWTPYQVILLYAIGHKQGRDGALPPWFSSLNWYAHFTAYANSFVNPIIYGGYNKLFREKFCYILRCRCRTAQFLRPVRSRITFTTGLKSGSSSQKTLNGSKKVCQPNIEMKSIHPITEGNLSPVVKDDQIQNM